MPQHLQRADATDNTESELEARLVIAATHGLGVRLSPAEAEICRDAIFALRRIRRRRQVETAIRAECSSVLERLE